MGSSIRQENSTEEDIEEIFLDALTGGIRERLASKRNREENEELIENLMNRIVAKPNFGDDTNMQRKIDKILKVKSFQKMVENADLL